MKTFNELNKKYHELAKGKVYPFISKDRLTPVEKGYHLKHNSNYRGLSAYWDHVNQDGYKVSLMGFYYVPFAFLVVPDRPLNIQEQALVKTYEQKGYVISVGGTPKLKPIEFDAGSEEYEVAVANKREYDLKKVVKNDKINK